MLIIVRNPIYRLISLGVTVAILVIVYFAVIKPNNDTANNAVRQGEKQLQHALSTSGATIPAGVKTLVQCITAAGTDATAIQACQTKFK